MGVSDNEFDDFIQHQKKEEYKQYIITKFDSKKNSGTISNFVSTKRGHGKGKNKQLPTMNQEKLKELLDEKWLISEVSKQQVDLIIKDYDKRYNLIEIKAGGNLDSSNAQGNIQKMMKFYYSLNKPNSKLYFATLYNYKGEYNKWTGGVTSFLSEDMLLISKEFWSFILPDNVSFYDFKEIYYSTFDELGFNDMIEDLLSN